MEVKEIEEMFEEMPSEEKKEMLQAVLSHKPPQGVLWFREKVCSRCRDGEWCSLSSEIMRNCILVELLRLFIDHL